MEESLWYTSKARKGGKGGTGTAKAVALMMMINEKMLQELKSRVSESVCVYVCVCCLYVSAWG